MGYFNGFNVEDLKSFHVTGLKKYLKRGVEIKRLDAKLLKLNVSKLADAIDPSADLDFDYLRYSNLIRPLPCGR